MWTFLGLLVLLGLAVDAFVTVLHPGSGAGPYTALQNRAIWRVGRVATKPSGLRRLLSLAGPTMALATPAAWVCLLTVGFAMLYRPAIEGFSTTSPVPAGPWGTAFYYSGYLTTTLGLGDVLPDGPGWRLIAVVQAAMGFALFSAAITYILSIYRQHTQGVALAAHVHNSFREGELPDWGADGSERRMRARAVATGAARDLVAVNVAHGQYPILQYFHDDAKQALVVQVRRLIEFAGRAPAGESGAANALRRAVEDFLDQMPFDTGDAERDDLAERHRRLVAAHGYEGS